MELKDIDWNKKLIIFFGDEVKNLSNNIRHNAIGYVDKFPEHHLNHPRRHIDYIEHIIRLLSRVDDRRFVIITNSSYIIDHLTNLMRGARINANAKYTRCGKKEAYIHKKDIGAYVCTEGDIKNALSVDDDEDCIDWDNLSEVADWLTDTYFNME